jgi:hypothetical protein
MRHPANACRRFVSEQAIAGEEKIMRLLAVLGVVGVIFCVARLREAQAAPLPYGAVMLAGSAQTQNTCSVSKPVSDRPPDDPSASSFARPGATWYANEDGTVWAWWVARFALALTFVTLLAEGATAQQSPAAAPLWVPEQAVSVAQRDGTIELKGSRGWIRLNSVFSDFVLEFDFQLATKSSSGSVSIRSRPGYGTDFPFYGYHLVLLC